MTLRLVDEHYIPPDDEKEGPLSCLREDLEGIHWLPGRMIAVKEVAGRIVLGVRNILLLIEDDPDVHEVDFFIRMGGHRENFYIHSGYATWPGMGDFLNEVWFYPWEVSIADFLAEEGEV